MHPSARIALFLLALALFVSTATPAVGHEAEPRDTPRAELAAIVESDPLVRARRVDAHLIAEWHEDHGHQVQIRGHGDPRHAWSNYRHQARRLRAYLLSRSELVRRFALVMHWAKVADCESSGRWAIDTGNGYYGGLQFSMGTWRAYGGVGRPQDRPNWYQAQIADHVRTRSGLHHWPVCGRYYR